MRLNESEADITQFKIGTLTQCLHEKLHFSSGAYYIMCFDCHETWVACMTGRGGGDRDPDYSQGSVPVSGSIRHI